MRVFECQIKYAAENVEDTIIFIKKMHTELHSFNNITFLLRHQKLLQPSCAECDKNIHTNAHFAAIKRTVPRFESLALCLKQVVYWEDDTKPETMGKVRVPWNQTSVTVSGLAGNTQYFLTVSAFNTAGTGPFLPAINVTTKRPRKSQHPERPSAQVIYISSTLFGIQRCRVYS